MIDLERNIGKFFGKKTTIGLIDSGTILQEDSIKHYGFLEEAISQDAGIVKDYHGTFCSKQILDIAPEASILDINCTNEKNEIELNKIIEGIEFCIKNKVDIINISLKVSEDNEKLYNVCEKAKRKNIIVVAASDNDLSYPSDYNNVIKVTNVNDTNENIVITHCIGVRNKTFECTINNKEYRLSASSSLATAYISGCLALVLEENPLITSENIINELFKKELWNFDLSKNFTIPPKSVLVLYSVLDNNLKYYKDMINDNILGYLDNFKNKFFDFEGNEILSNIENIIEINSTEKKKNSILNNAKYNNIPKYIIGNIDNISSDTKVIKSTTHNMGGKSKYIIKNKVPVISIVGFGYSSNKFYTQLSFCSQLEKSDIKTECITYNPLGYIFDFNVLEYPDIVKFPDMVYSINNYFDVIYRTKKEFDLFLVDIAGGISEINLFNTNNYGELFNAYSKALDIDVVIFCVNLSISVEELKKAIMHIKSKNIQHIFVVLTNLCYEDSSFIRSNGLKFCLAEEKDRENYYNELIQDKEIDVSIFYDNDEGIQRLTKAVLNLYK